MTASPYEEDGSGTIREASIGSTYNLDDTSPYDESSNKSKIEVKCTQARNPTDRNNLCILNAHMKCTETFIEQHFSFAQSFGTLYFLVHKARDSPRTREALMNADMPAADRVSLLLYLNDADFLCNFAHHLLRLSLDSRIRKKIRMFKNVNSSLIYFMATGLVNIKNPVFFVKCMRCAMHTVDNGRTLSKEGLKYVFGKYINAVDQPTFDVFYSICWALREHISAADVNAEHNISPGNDPENISNTNNKLRLKCRDMALHFICDFVIEARKGSLVEIAIDFTKTGFVKMSENEIEMVRYNQVIYE